ncbi:unnamed protein product [Mycena citricolor]|uniref:Glucose-methanol-choline oxidoreductase N-terminal domain-containing protein n=1 Tax=Mycena citricolor TaxID=2018698 RepID=A0AAD2K312_9AGAR|nr:unnamed protein product [Mycena citricolor]
MGSYPSKSLKDVSGKSYQYVVIGGGAAGCVVAARLSEDPNITVLVLERGPVVDSWLSKIPLFSSNITDKNAPVYRIPSAPAKALGDQTMTLVGGKALGGSTKVNALLYTRSTPGEYNAWERAGRKGWGWDAVEPFFKKSEHYSAAAGLSFRGSKGPWQTRGSPEITFESTTRALDAVPSLGIQTVKMDNDPSSPAVVCTLLDTTIDPHGRRSDTMQAFLPSKVVRTRKNLHVCTESGTEQFRVSVEKEAVLCAGAIASPHILLLSGVGPRDDLAPLNIPLVKHLPGVGAHLQDHVSVPIIYQVPITDSIDLLIERPLAAIPQLFKYVFTGRGILGNQVQQANIMFRTSLADVQNASPQDLDAQNPDNVPDAEIMLLPVNPSGARPSGFPKSAGTFSIMTTAVRPKSTGSVKLALADPRAQPICDLGMLMDASDRVPLRKALKSALELGRAVQKSGYSISEYDAPASESDADLDAFITAKSITTYHYSSSCRMAEENEGGVVDDELRVHGLAGLRIADASVFPWVPACHLQAPVVMIAERCAEFVKNSRAL